MLEVMGKGIYRDQPSQVPQTLLLVTARVKSRERWVSFTPVMHFQENRKSDDFFRCLKSGVIDNLIERQSDPLKTQVFHMADIDNFILVV